MTFEAEGEGNVIAYSFEGEATAERMAGRVLFGVVNGIHRGVLNLRQHGGGTWEAKRLD
jgi:hypothetical protein